MAHPPRANGARVPGARRSACLGALTLLAACASARGDGPRAFDGGSVTPDGCAPPPDAGANDAVTSPTGVGCNAVTSEPIAGRDCSGSTFPSRNAPGCATTQPIHIVYPPDGVLLPPNLHVLSVQWTPYGGPFTRFEVDFTQSAGDVTTDLRIVTSCKEETTDAQTDPPAPSGGCEIVVDAVSWACLVAANRGLDNPIAITVRGTSDGNCATTSDNVTRVSISPEDVLGTYYYWKASFSANSSGGQVWKKGFGDLGTPEKDVTSAAVPNASCNGCHSLSLDGTRMVVLSDDGDLDDEYGDLGASVFDMTTPELEGVPRALTGGQPPGWTAFHPLGSYYITSNGVPLSTTAPSSTSYGYQGAVPTNGFSLWNEATGAFVTGVAVGPDGTRPTMLDWSIDATSVVYVQPSAVATWDEDAGTGARNDDDHIFGGSLYTVPYLGSGAFGTPVPLLQSAGENNYYPTFSPDHPTSFVLFNRAPLDTSAGTLDGCTRSGDEVHCPNDSFYNPAARLMIVGAVGGSTPIDLERANGSPLASPAALSNSYPRWAPFLAPAQGAPSLLWFTFASTRDYGLRVLNHKPGMHPCYPPDSYELPGVTPAQLPSPACQQPQLWMASVAVTAGQDPTVDPSSVAFWIPYQDITTHNHTAQWTQEIPPGPEGTCSMIYGACGPHNAAFGCCPGRGLVCSGDSQCIIAKP